MFLLEHIGTIPSGEYASGASAIGIRIADVFSFLLNAVILMIISEIEEIKMKQKFPEEYTKYSQQAGFMFPKIRRKKEAKEIVVEEKTKKQLIINYSMIIGLYLIGYIVFVVIIFLLVKYTSLIPLIYTR